MDAKTKIKKASAIPSKGKSSLLAPREPWPALPWQDWAPTIGTVQRWAQIIGGVHLALASPLDHWWNVPLEVTANGLTTGPIDDGAHHFEVDVDCIQHRLGITHSRNGSFVMNLEPMSVAAFYREFLRGLRGLGIGAQIPTSPVVIVDALPFEADEDHRSYEPSHASALWRGVLQADHAMRAFQVGFLGQQRPAQFFWGSFDVAATRSAGRLGEEFGIGWRPRETAPGPTFYAYVHPEPEGIRSAQVEPADAWFDPEFGEFVLPYDAVRTSADPDALVLEFFRSTYEASAGLAGWDRSALEPIARPRRRRKAFSIWLTDAPW
jgi:hypothetical protein